MIKQTGASAANYQDILNGETDLRSSDVLIGVNLNNLDDKSELKLIGDKLWLHPNGKIFSVSSNGEIIRVISPGDRDYIYTRGRN
jgi:hypothetical protein